MIIERKSLDISNGINEQGIFTGHASVFGVVDEENDVVEPGAFAETLATGDAKDGVYIFGQHEDEKLPIGKTLELREDSKGLYVKGLISATPEGLAYRQLVKDKVLTKMSIGYIVEDFKNDENGIRHIYKMRLLEISIVNYPANTGANITSYKGGTKLMDGLTNDTPETVAFSMEELANLIEDASERGAVKALKQFAGDDGETKTAAAEGDEGETKSAPAEGDEGAKNDDEAASEAKGQKSRQQNPRQAAQRKYADIYMNTGAQVERKSTGLPKGHGWVRYNKAMIQAKGDPDQAAHIARKSYKDSMMEREIKAVGQNMTNPSDGGYLVPETYASEVIELLQARAILLQLGATVLPVDNGTMNLPRVTEGTTAGYVGEMRKSKESKLTLGNDRLSMKKLMTKIPISNDLIRSNTYGADTLVLNDAVRSMALAYDKAGFMGKGTEFSPRGLFNVPGVPSIMLNAVPGTTTSGQMLAKLIQNNVDTSKLGWAMNGYAWEKFYNVVDPTSGLFVYRQQMDEGKLNGHEYAISNQLEIGADTHKTTKIVLGNWSEFIIGRQGQMQSEIFREGSITLDDGSIISAVDNDCVILRCIDLHDFALRHKESFVIGELYTA